MLPDLLARVLSDVGHTLAVNWPFLLASVLMAAALEVHVGTDRLGSWLRRRTPVAVLGAVSLASLTPFCSCGTTAVTLGMLASAAPWAPIVAFMVASPLTSPSELVLSGGLLGWPFAWLFFGGTIALGLVAGGAAYLLERLGWLTDQARMRTPAAACSDSCDVDATTEAAPPVPVGALSLGPGAAAVTEVGTWRQRARLDELGRATWTIGRRLALFFLAFTALGYLVIEAIPTTWIQSHLGGGSLGSILAAALLGVPAYINTEGSLPLLAGLVEGGMGPGPAMAFLVTGAGTSLGAVAGMLVIARRRVVGLVVVTLLAGAVGLGVAAQALLG